MAKTKAKVEAVKAWVVFYLYEDGTVYAAESIGRSKEQAWARFKRLFPEVPADNGAWVCRRVELRHVSRRQG